MEEHSITGYLAAPGFLKELTDELVDILEVFDHLVIAPGPPRDACWAHNIWLNPEKITVTSITDAAKQLKARGRAWANYPFENFRRTALISEQIPTVKNEKVHFLDKPNETPPGSWILTSPNEMIAATKCTAHFPHGEITFHEDRNNPPSRAYLKLWEVFTKFQKFPKPGDRCIDLGSSPGGWTWVLGNLKTQVMSVDKAPLAPNVAKMPGVKYIQESAFNLKPEKVGPVDWLFSDIICYPERLFNLVSRWRDIGQAKNFVCTIKLQGPTDQEAIKKFAQIPGSKIVHLCNNKHELTWLNFS